LSVVRDHAPVFVLDDNVRAGSIDEEPTFHRPLQLEFLP